MPLREYRRNAWLIAAGSLTIGALIGAAREIIHPTKETP